MHAVWIHLFDFLLNYIGLIVVIWKTSLLFTTTWMCDVLFEEFLLTNFIYPAMQLVTFTSVFHIRETFVNRLV